MSIAERDATHQIDLEGAWGGAAAQAARELAPATRRRRVHWDRSLVTYFQMLAAGAVVGVKVASDFLASKAGVCSGADAAGRCMLDQLAAPALTRFALVVVCAHGLATLVLDVLPEIARKLRAGYRPRRAVRPAPLPPPVPGQPVSALAAACWAPAQAPRKARTRSEPLMPSAGPLAPPVPRPRGPRAVCPACVTIVVVSDGACPDCRSGVVARRG